jgi:hypothetical protein
LRYFGATHYLKAVLLAESANPMRNFARMENTAHWLHSNTKLVAEAERPTPSAEAE